jgi:hypothetical protein
MIPSGGKIDSAMNCTGMTLGPMDSIRYGSRRRFAIPAGSDGFRKWKSNSEDKAEASPSSGRNVLQAQGCDRGNPY